MNTKVKTGANDIESSHPRSDLPFTTSSTLVLVNSQQSKAHSYFHTTKEEFLSLRMVLYNPRDTYTAGIITSTNDEISTMQYTQVKAMMITKGVNPL